jgi:hemerythrin
MSFIVWNTDWSIGVDEIDAQHQDWLAILNDLYEAMAAGTDKDSLGAILDRLVSYCGWHFAAEEQMMRRSGYPGFAAHQAEHNELTERVFTTQLKRDHGLDLGLSVETLTVLRDWITHHILGSDLAFARFLNAGADGGTA